MSSFKEDVTRIQSLISDAFTETGGLAALANGGVMNQEKLQRELEQTTEKFEQAALELRVLAEKNSPGVGSYGRRPHLPPIEITGSVNIIEYSWLHIRLNTLLPHCRFQTPNWLSDTIRRLLDDPALRRSLGERAAAKKDSGRDLEKLLALLEEE